MEIALLLIIIILMIIFASGNARLRSMVEDLREIAERQNRELKQLGQDVKQLSYQPRPATDTPPRQASETPAERRPEPPPATPRQEPMPAPPPIVIKEQTLPEPEPAPAAPVKQGGSYTAPPLTAPKASVMEPEESFFDKWLRNNPDIEKFIGENLLNKIGIAILVLGIAFFVKYAIDQDWINKTGRVCIGILCGLLLSGTAHYLRQNYRAFSSVLAGGGIAVYYATIAFAFQSYGLFPQTAAFIIMVVITAFAILLSVWYDRIELAVIAAIGGFITPFLVSNGSGNHIVLFTYLLILNLGLLTLAYYKQWRLVNIVALGFTLLIYGGWMIKTDPSQPAFPYSAAFIFGSCFYIIFLGMNMIYQVAYRKPFRALDFSLLLATTFSYYAAGMTLLHYWHQGSYQGLFTVMVGAVNCALSFYCYRTQKLADKNLLYLLIGLTLTFLSLAAPVQLHGHTITMFWFAEFVLLYWLSQRSGILLFRYSSLIVGMLAGISLVMDWGIAANQPGHRLFILFSDARGIITNAIAIAALGLYHRLLRNREESFLPGISSRLAGNVMLTAAVLMLYISLLSGINLVFVQEGDYHKPNVFYRLITLAFIAGFRYADRRSKQFVLLQPILTVAALLLALISTPSVHTLRMAVLHHQDSPVFMLLHWMSDVFLGVLIFYTIRGIRSNALLRPVHQAITWAACVGIMVWLSIEVQHVYIMAGFSGNNEALLAAQYAKAGLAILWSLLSFALMWLGMRHRYKPLRIVSLSLFSLTLLKLFVYDIRNISEGGKIAAFVLLGVVLLAVSFMYQKLKKIIIDGNAEQ